ncbi:cell division protein ZapE [Glutamicibacter halophytocola]|uniref:cell division protein ZapE n=1 Tax=Glutamicibacter halophytocola TaxID=1933880 RepID=UPI0015C53E28|nr:cell division protein ZapE [Glutamicibacter halophytocola]NQD40148.1 cell division protein ZapE [Glutamicibacter halophytocola]
MPEPSLRNSAKNALAKQILDSLAAEGIIADPTQQQLINVLGKTVGPASKNAPQGAYIYGPPGRGKTVIANSLVAHLPAHSTRRFHFHEFFHQLNSPKNRVPGQPLGAIFSQGLERELAGIQVLIFDEFHCTEPGDAMFMGKLVKYCKQHDIQLVTTSNYAPEKLLDDDAFHHLVTPIIESIRADYEVFELDHELDYRLRKAEMEGATSGYRSGSLTLLPQQAPRDSLETWIEIGYDRIGPARQAGEAIWISFDQICRTRRNTADYLELATRFPRWHITQIPSSELMPMDEERRLANLIDVFYDKDIEVHLYAEDDLSQLGHMLHAAEKARLTSRLAQLHRHNIERTTVSP